MVKRPEMAWRDVVCAWLLLRATATASSSARAVSSVKHCLAVLTGVGIAAGLVLIQNHESQLQDQTQTTPTNKKDHKRRRRW